MIREGRAFMKRLVEEAIEELKRGKLILVVDDEDREAEIMCNAAYKVEDEGM